MSHFFSPSNLDEACTLYDNHPKSLLIAGCTDVFVDGSTSKAARQGVINVFGIDELRFINVHGNTLSMGASTTYSDVLKSQAVKTHLPMLADACRLIGAMQIQSRATLGGNVATSSPVGDTLPVWLASDASIEVISVDGPRMIPYEKFITGYRQIDLKANELIKAIHVPLRGGENIQRFIKIGTRAFQSISKVMMAGAARPKNNRVYDLRLALGAVAATPIRLKKVETLFEGQELTPALLNKAEALILEELKPIDDLRSSAAYRSEVAKNSCLVFVKNLI